MKKQKKSKNKFGLFIIITLLIIGITFALYKSNNPKAVTIQSPELDLSIRVPSHYEVVQNFHEISIKEKKGEIIVSLSGSFFKDLESHLNDLSEKNNVKIEIIQKYNNNFYKVKFNHYNSPQPTDITYFILVDHAVYSFQANSEELYTDLDAIAKSFRYNP